MKILSKYEPYIYIGVGVAFLIVALVQPRYHTLSLAGAVLIAAGAYKKGKSDTLSRMKEKKEIIKKLERDDTTDLRIN